MTNLSTTYLGLALKSPIVASPSPLCEELKNIRRMEDAGLGAVVLHSLFEEQIEQEGEAVDSWLHAGTETYAEALSYFPEVESFNLGPDGYLEHIRKAKEAVSIPIIASLNGVSAGGWTRYAKKIEQAGADALELNIYFLPTDARKSAEQIEDGYLAMVREVLQSVSIPVAVKLGSGFTAPAHLAKKLDAAGAKGMVLFNRFYQPDIDIESREVSSDLHLSTPQELRLRLRWAAIIYGQVALDLAITGGVHSHEDVIKGIMAGATVTMMTSALLNRGIDYARTVKHSLAAWLDEHEYASVDQMRGSVSHQSVADPAAFERANYMKILKSYVPQLA